VLCAQRTTVGHAAEGAPRNRTREGILRLIVEASPHIGDRAHDVPERAGALLANRCASCE
jgi:hypothetical protein